MPSLGLFLYYTVVTTLTGGFLQASSRLLSRRRIGVFLFWAGMFAFWLASGFLGLTVVFLLALRGDLFHWYPPAA